MNIAIDFHFGVLMITSGILRILVDKKQFQISQKKRETGNFLNSDFLIPDYNQIFSVRVGNSRKRF